jgi:hypothetical protein
LEDTAAFESRDAITNHDQSIQIIFRRCFFTRTCFDRDRGTSWRHPDMAEMSESALSARAALLQRT